MSAHAKRSPSGAAGWLSCAGWAGGGGSSHASEGTVAHEVAARALTSGQPTSADLGWTMAVEGHASTVGAEMVEATQRYVDQVNDLTRADDSFDLRVEVRLPIGHITGEADAHGTSDAVIVLPTVRELIVADLKYGRGVAVEAEGNDQLVIYALAALDQVSLSTDIDTVRMVICQPRLHSTTEWVQTAEQMEAHRERIQARIAALDAAPEQREPSDKGCRWCSRKGTCEALASQALAAVADDFVDLTAPLAPQLAGVTERVQASDGAHIGALLAQADLIEGWLKALRAEAERRLLAGQPVDGFKLVEGRRGARAWQDPAEAEAVLKSMRLRVEDMYDLSLISPTTAEKLHTTTVIGPRQWRKVEALMVRRDGKPSVAPVTDKRPALAAPTDDFEVLS